VCVCVSVVVVVVCHFTHHFSVHSLDILYDTGAQRVSSSSGDSVSSFLEHVKGDLYLRHACPGSKFASIFVDQMNQGYVQ